MTHVRTLELIYQTRCENGVRGRCAGCTRRNLVCDQAELLALKTDAGVRQPRQTAPAVLARESQQTATMCAPQAPSILPRHSPGRKTSHAGPIASHVPQQRTSHENWYRPRGKPYSTRPIYQARVSHMRTPSEGTSEGTASGSSTSERPEELVAATRPAHPFPHSH